MKYLVILLCLTLSGCIEVAPNLKFPEAKECPKPIVKEQPPVQTKTTLEMPPIPEKVNIVIDGDKVKVDKGGDILLRYYVQARELLR